MITDHRAYPLTCTIFQSVWLLGTFDILAEKKKQRHILFYATFDLLLRFWFDDFVHLGNILSDNNFTVEYATVKRTVGNHSNYRSGKILQLPRHYAFQIYEYEIIMVWR